jgi:glyoxylase-like metal-dependent hydrolase (beta-lactamase superfamily II)
VSGIDPNADATVTVGLARITAVLDSEGPFFQPLREAFPGATEAALAEADLIDPSPSSDPDQWWLAFRAYAVDLGGRVVLVDTGAASDTPARSSWAPLGPHLTESLSVAVGISPDDVTHAVLTHLHGDHTAGSVDARGRPAFPNAEYLVPPPTSTLSRRATRQLRLCEAEVEVVRGVRILPTPGHTPGHQSVLVEDGHESAVLAGDVVLHAVQLTKPDIRNLHDDDHAIAARSRYELLARWRAASGLLGTAHLTLPWLTVSALPDEVRLRNR